MKKIFLSLFMALIMMFSFSMTVFAIGEGDVDTGGGSAGDTEIERVIRQNAKV